MTETILVNLGPAETRVALLANGVVQDIHIERGPRPDIVGNIYSGKVTRVMPGMQAAFVDFGGERTGLLHVSELVGGAGRSLGKGVQPEPTIEYRLRAGQKLVVQVTRDPLAGKGARLTTRLSLASRFLAFMPWSTQTAVSRAIEDTGERARLLLLLREALAAEGLAGEGAYILRTAAEGITLADLRADLRFLQRLWASVCNRGRDATGSALLYRDLPLHLRVARDLARPTLQRILVDDYTGFLALRGFCEEFVPEMTDRLEHHPGPSPLFDLYGVEQEIQAALGRRVDLACGGYLVIDQTEAMTTVDVNTGSFVGRRNVDETIYQTNLEAAVVLARQLRLRNLGGIIVIDFIDMADREHRQQVQLALQQVLQQDPVRTTFNGMSGLGLVALTRKRQGESLQHLLCVECPVCQGGGILRSARTVCYDIFRQLQRTGAGRDTRELTVLAAPAVIELLRGEAAGTLAELAHVLGREIHLRAEPMYSQEHFDIAVI